MNVLPRVIEAVRPLVLPKLREENERVKARGRKKGVRDVVVEGRSLIRSLFPAQELEGKVCTRRPEC